MTTTHVVQGIPLPPGGGPLPTRKEISAWISQAQTDDLSARQVALFIKAMDAFQKMDPADELSYYRIAGRSNLPPFWNCGITVRYRNPWRPRDSLGWRPESATPNRSKPGSLNWLVVRS
jgi:hypothetical protein